MKQWISLSSPFLNDQLSKKKGSEMVGIYYQRAVQFPPDVAQQ